ncbi:MAG: DUF615 domain-containing protein [Betaproteobacteria bacterium]|nr:DUF615 domain-containing protein [Betaproteobacteria bacterium]
MEILDPPSKSQRKRDMTALQNLGESLLGLNRHQLDQLDLPESLYDAIQEAKSITAHGARRRQLQFIGKLMRQVDPAPIQSFLDQLPRRPRS